MIDASDDILHRDSDRSSAALLSHKKHMLVRLVFHHYVGVQPERG